MEKIQNILDTRAKIFEQMEDLRNRVKTEGRDLSADESEQWDRMFEDYKDLSKKLEQVQERTKKEKEREESFAKMQEDQQRSVFTEYTQTSTARPEDKIEVTYKSAIEKWMRNPKSLSSKEYSVINAGEVRGTNVNVTTTDGLGGFVVPEEWRNELIKTMEAFGGMLQVSRIISTSDGRQMHVPTVPFAGGGAAATQKGHLITETTADTVSDINLQEKLLDAYVYSSFEIQVSWELMQDSLFDFVRLVFDIGGERVGRIVNEHLTTGTGTGQPNGVVTAAPSLVTSATIAVLAEDDLIDLKYALDPAYRSGAIWMFNDSTLADIVKLSYGTSNTAIWVPSFAPEVPDRILGHSYVINQDMADVATSNKAVLFGDFSKYWVRRAGYPTVARSDERYIETRKSTFFVFDRIDGELVDTNAIGAITIQ